jgi:pimeloyl-ACP methyl ester carboxylesterase
MKAKILFFLMMVGLLAACKKESSTEGDQFFLRSEGADMPVWVRGNKSARVFILVLHGGPGSYVSEYIGMPAFNSLEHEYAVVYWDQRASGDSQGNAKPESLTREQFVRDLDKLVALIQNKYNQPTLFLLGHSWGGTLGTLYLLDAQRQSKIKGWIQVDGLHDTNAAYQLSRAFVMNYAQQQVSAGNQVEKWQKIIRWYEEHPTSELGEASKHPEYVDEANGYYYKDNPGQEASLKAIFNSPRAGLAELYNSRYVARHEKSLLEGLDLSSQMPAITLPTLILWGKHDGILPLPLAQDYYSKLGTPAAQKPVVVFEESAHSPMAEEPAKFANEVIRFVASYK